MIYTLYCSIFLIFIALSFRLYKILLKATDIMKYMFYTIFYVVGILITFQVVEKIVNNLFVPTKKETGFMLLVYLLTTMIGFISVAIITIKKLKKK